MVQLIQDFQCSKCGAINEKEEKWENGEIIWRCKSCQHTKTIGTYSTTPIVKDVYLVIEPDSEIPPSKITF
jgi:ribosomal protein L37AE/L43A